MNKAKEKNLSDFNYENIDEHKVSQEVIKVFEDYKRKRDNYKKYGPLFVIISGVVFLTLMFSLDAKIEFLILWVFSDFYCAALMVRAEYKYHQYAKILGFTEDENDEIAEEED